jgi:hypothetical protein
VERSSCRRDCGPRPAKNGQKIGKAVGGLGQEVASVEDEVRRQRVDAGNDVLQIVDLVQRIEVDVAQHGRGQRFGQPEFDLDRNNLDRVSLNEPRVPRAGPQPDRGGEERAFDEGSGKEQPRRPSYVTRLAIAESMEPIVPPTLPRMPCNCCKAAKPTMAAGA